MVCAAEEGLFERRRSHRGNCRQPGGDTNETLEGDMSPLFRKTGEGSEDEASGHDHLPSLYELGSQVDDVVKTAAALPLEQFAEQLMNQFSTEYLVASKMTSVSSVDTLSWNLLPDNSGESARDPIPDAFFCLQDLVTEAVQLLRNAGLVMERSYKVGQGGAYSQWLTGLVTTRRGRSALEEKTVQPILRQVYGPPT